MNELFSQLFGQQPSYAPMVFGDEAERLRRQAQQQGLLNLGLSLLSGSGPSAQPRGIGQLLAQGVQAGQQAYQGAYNKALQDQMLKQQLQQQQQAQMEQQAAQQLLPQILRPGAQTPTFYGQPTQMPLRDDEGNIMPGAGVSVSGPQLDISRLLSLPVGVQQRIMPQITAATELLPKARKAGLVGEQAPQENPFTIFTQDPTIPQNVRTIATQYARSFASGGIDPEKVDERVRQLGEMVQRSQQFETTQAGLAEQRRATNLLAQGQQQIQRMSVEDRIERAKEKAAEKEQTKTEAKDQLTATVEQLKKNYDTLLSEGGIVSTKSGTMANVGAAISGSGLGRMVGGAVGTKTQEQRQAIEQTRPLLLNLIKNATGMSAQQMNSNAEMQLYLNAATNPNLSYEANMEALANLDRLFGLGSAAKKIEEETKKAPATQSRSGW
jgi:hypothetical protein